MKKEKSVSDAIKYRRSVRVFNNDDIDPDKVKKCYEKESDVRHHYRKSNTYSFNEQALIIKKNSKYYKISKESMR